MKKLVIILLLASFACERKPKTEIAAWQPYNESQELAANQDHESVRMRYKLIQSKVTDKNDIWATVADQIAYFSEEDYQKLEPLILNQDIPTLQNHVKSGALSYELLTQWYLHRIVKYENDRNTMLNAIIALNPDAVEIAKQRDKEAAEDNPPIFGIPVLLKDNINTVGMNTTAGTELLKNNQTPDAYIVERLKDKGAIILGKTNLSEWANYLCLECPNGYSAAGGQTLNAYGRKKFDTGGSSSGSGVAMAANYAAAAVGTETSGSILSPSSASSLVGLKPTTGLLSRSGIVPLSSTLDTPGPMTRTVVDNAIMMDAMQGKDEEDPASSGNPESKMYMQNLEKGSLRGLKLGINKNLLTDSIYKITVTKLKALGAETIEFEPEQPDFGGFVDLLNADMRVDLPAYINKYAKDAVKVNNIEDIIAYNKQDSTVRIPYGQGRFEGMLVTDLTETELQELKDRLKKEGMRFFETPMQKHDLDAVLSINNYYAGYAAAAQYPCLTVPMGYTDDGEPKGLTFIARPYEEDKLLKMGYAFEQ
ncbi:amidase, partial [Fulvivirga sp. RKSG066]|uniref:amidase family protein n=1 Tax=Fulvivirga aurantia TaxID=2529383 RepID=UPI0012BB4D99